MDKEFNQFCNIVLDTMGYLGKDKTYDNPNKN